MEQQQQLIVVHSKTTYLLNGFFPIDTNDSFKLSADIKIGMCTRHGQTKALNNKAASLKQGSFQLAALVWPQYQQL